MKAIFFDLDGTLLDHDYAQRVAALALLERYRGLLPYAEGDFVQFWYGLSEKYSTRQERGEISRTEKRLMWMREVFRNETIPDEEAVRRFEMYVGDYENNCRLYQDAVPCLDVLRGIPLGIITNGRPDMQRGKVEKTGIVDRFVPIVTSEEIGIAKPDVGIFQEACRRAGCEPVEAVYVGDSLEKDIVGSRNAGMVPVWLNRKSTDGYQGVKVIHTLAELPQILGGILAD